MALTVGQKAPDFTLFDTEKKEVSLQDYKGSNVLLLFFPLAFTGVCTKELCSTRDELVAYNNLKTKVLAISIDTLFTLAKFKEINNLTFPLLSDFNKKTCADYGCLNPEFVFKMQGVAKRSAFIVDGNGIIKYAEILEDAGNLPDFNAIKETLNSLQKEVVS